MAARCSNMDTLPQDCISTILSYASPMEAFAFSMLSSTFRSAALSDMVWQSFLPSDYEDIVSRAVTTLHCSSKRELFHALCRSILIDEGYKSFHLDKFSGKKCYTISARELSVTWINSPMSWSWKRMQESRFSVAAELRTVSWLIIQGTIRTQILTPNTRYAAYLVMKVSRRAYGLGSVASEVSVEVRDKVQRGRAYLCRRDRVIEEHQRFPSIREDGWLEIELGEFFSGEEDEEVSMSLMELGHQLKGGLILEGIEDVGKFSVISSTVRSMANSDSIWEKFLPPNYQEILTRLVAPLVYSSKKDLFLSLSRPHLIDAGTKMFSIEKSTGIICYMLSARELTIAWGSSPLYWSWKPLQSSRFAVVAELRTICWLEIKGSINTQTLSPKTIYGAYLILKIADRAYGLDSLPSEVSLDIGYFKSKGSVFLRWPSKEKDPTQYLRTRASMGNEKFLRKRHDQWLEIELGSFFNEGGDTEVKMCLKEIKGVHLKGGLIVEGIEVRAIPL